MAKIIINATNLHVGGGVQVAASFIEELAGLLRTSRHQDLEFVVYASNEVHANLKTTRIAFDVFERYEVFDIYGLRGALANAKKFYGHDVCFTIFGPSYLKAHCRYAITGFAQPWIVYPHSPAYQLVPLFERWLLRAKLVLQWQFFRRSDRLVVEAPHVKAGLVSGKGLNASSVDVVENCFSSLFLDQGRWKAIDFDFTKLYERPVTLGFLGNGYVHKNLRVLKDVGRLLRDEFGFKCNFLFTINEADMRDHGFDKLDNFFTVGGISVAQCPDFYNHIDALVFPSLLECFSVSPVEAMVMRTPVFASNSPFVKDVCGEHAFYFDPTDSSDIARVIACGLMDPERLKVMKDRAYEHALTLPTAQDRAKKYLTILIDGVRSGRGESRV